LCDADIKYILIGGKKTRQFFVNDRMINFSNTEWQKKINWITTHFIDLNAFIFIALNMNRKKNMLAS
jgi:type II restriction/modification system DNA methylase subunit YeeA